MKLFDTKMMQYRNDLHDWKNVISAGVDLLVKEGYATNELADAIFQSTNEYGAYYVLEKGLALLHAQPGPYAIKPGTSTLILDRYVEFNNQPEKSAKIIITLSATDSNSHIQIIQQFADYFMNEDFKKEALKAKSLANFLEIVDKYKGEKNEH